MFVSTGTPRGRFPCEARSSHLAMSWLCSGCKSCWILVAGWVELMIIRTERRAGQGEDGEFDILYKLVHVATKTELEAAREVILLRGDGKLTECHTLYVHPAARAIVLRTYIRSLTYSCSSLYSGNHFKAHLQGGETPIGVTTCKLSGAQETRSSALRNVALEDPTVLYGKFRQISSASLLYVNYVRVVREYTAQPIRSGILMVWE